MPPLQTMRRVHFEDGSPLSLDCKLRGLLQSKILPLDTILLDLGTRLGGVQLLGGHNRMGELGHRYEVQLADAGVLFLGLHLGIDRDFLLAIPCLLAGQWTDYHRVL